MVVLDAGIGFIPAWIAVVQPHIILQCSVGYSLQMSIGVVKHMIRNSDKDDDGVDLVFKFRQAVI